MAESQTYSRRFEIKPRAGRYADMKTCNEYEQEVVGRWNTLIRSMIPRARIKFQQQTQSFGNLGLYCQIGEFDDHDYLLARFKDMNHVIVPTPNGFVTANDPEFEVMLVTDNKSLPDIAREIMESDLPDFITASEAKRLYLAERGSSFSVMVREGIV